MERQISNFSSSVCAVVVSFNGPDELWSTLLALAPQVGGIYVIDNGSSIENKEKIHRFLSWFENVELVTLGRNSGIGFALNCGVEYALKRGFSWVLTMDQDSEVSPDFIGAYEKFISACSNAFFLAPNINCALDGGQKLPAFCITSGNLINTCVYSSVGCYNEALFIDGVDVEFSIRVREAGFTAFHVANARMSHSLGDYHCKPIFFNRFHSYHSPLRRYYIYRNSIYVARFFFARHPIFIMKMLFSRVLYLLTILLLGKNRLASYKYIMLGIFHASIGKTGALGGGDKG